MPVEEHHADAEHITGAGAVAVLGDRGWRFDNEASPLIKARPGSAHVDHDSLRSPFFKPSESIVEAG